MGFVQQIGGKLFRIVPAGATVRILSGPNRGRKWIRGAAHCPEWLGIYEKENQRKIAGIVTQGMTVLDVGANVGFFTLLMSRLVGPTGRVFAFEPLPANAARLIHHIDINSLSNVTVSEVAISREDGEASFSTGADCYHGRLEEDGTASVRVPIASIDSLLKSGRIVLPDFMKIDIEGAEFDLLQGCKVMFESNRPPILLSMHGPDQRERCLTFLREHGYRIEPLGDQKAENTDVLALSDMGH